MGTMSHSSIEHSIEHSSEPVSEHDPQRVSRHRTVLMRPNDAGIAALVEQGLDVVPVVVASLAARFPRHVDRAELLRAGILGVVEAAWRFDPTRGVPFERFAARRVRGAVLDAVRADDWMPRSVRAAARRIELVDTALTARFGRRPTAAEIGRELDLSADRVDRVRAAAAAGVIDRIDLFDDVPGTIDGQSVEPTAALEREELLVYLRDALGSLSDRHRRVILGQFVEGRTSLDLADELGVSRSRVSQLRSEALAELRRRITVRYEPLRAAD